MVIFVKKTNDSIFRLKNKWAGAETEKKALYDKELPDKRVAQHVSNFQANIFHSNFGRRPAFCYSEKSEF